MSSTRIWPWWVRLSHWVVAAGILALWVLVYAYFETDTIHRWIGYGITIIIGVRVMAGCFTPTPAARFKWPTWQQVTLHLGHLKTRKLPESDGHNPLGQIAVYVMWTLIALLALTGWLSRTDAFWGEDWPVDLHAGLSALLMAAVVIHILAVILTSRLSGQRLIMQMLDGKRHMAEKENR